MKFPDLYVPVTAMMATPISFPVTTPFESMLATVGSSDCQLKETLSIFFSRGGYCDR
ncbi:MAG: hypothetical protein MPW15_20655 [Candidatus Manganitrophus sp.]|nr:hypothetical protein [Candidatus Manganitrophus sp.]